MAVDSYGLPIEFHITGGEVHDSKAAPTLRYAAKFGLYHCR